MHFKSNCWLRSSCLNWHYTQTAAQTCQTPAAGLRSSPFGTPGWALDIEPNKAFIAGTGSELARAGIVHGLPGATTGRMVPLF
jgi:hypothetical protein